MVLFFFVALDVVVVVAADVILIIVLFTIGFFTFVTPYCHDDYFSQ